MSGFEVSKEDIDPSEFSEEELQEILFNGLFCAKIMETFAETQDGAFAAYDVIKHFEEVPHERTPSDLIQEKALSDSESSENKNEKAESVENDETEDDMDWNEAIRKLTE